MGTWSRTLPTRRGGSWSLHCAVMLETLWLLLVSVGEAAPVPQCSGPGTTSDPPGLKVGVGLSLECLGCVLGFSDLAGSLWGISGCFGCKLQKIPPENTRSRKSWSKRDILGPTVTESQSGPGLACACVRRPFSSLPAFAPLSASSHILAPLKVARQLPGFLFWI